MLGLRGTVLRHRCRKPGFDWRPDRMKEELGRCRHPNDHSRSSQTLAVGDPIRCQFCRGLHMYLSHTDPPPKKLFTILPKPPLWLDRPEWLDEACEPCWGFS